MIPPNIRLIAEVFSGLHAEEEGFRPRRGQPEAGTRYPLPKTENSSDLTHYVSGETCNFIIVFAIILFNFSIPVRRGGGTPPLAASLQLGVSIPGKFTTEWLNTPYWQWIRNKCRLGLRTIHNMAAHALLKSQNSFQCSEPTNHSALCWLFGTLLVTRPCS